MKNPPTPAGIEPAIFRFVEQHRDHSAAAVPFCWPLSYKKKNLPGRGLTKVEEQWTRHLQLPDLFLYSDMATKYFTSDNYLLDSCFYGCDGG